MDTFLVSKTTTKMKPLPKLIHGSKILAKAMNIDIFNCPLFLWECPPHKDSEYISDAIDASYEVLSKYPNPYNEIRILFNRKTELFDERKSCWREFDLYHFLFMQKRKDPHNGLNTYFCLGQLIGTEEEQKDAAIAFEIVPHHNPKRKCFIKVEGYSWDNKEVEVIGGRETFELLVDRESEKHAKDDVDRRMAANCSLLFQGAAEMIRSISDRDKRIVEVTPNPNAKEVQWLEGRKHYVVLSNKEAIQRSCNPMELKACEVITRIAHNRRSHTRTLRSPRFKNKQGLTVFVKEHWVGPKEWMDKSQSRYRVLLG